MSAGLRQRMSYQDKAPALRLHADREDINGETTYLVTLVVPERVLTAILAPIVYPWALVRLLRRMGEFDPAEGWPEVEGAR